MKVFYFQRNRTGNGKADINMATTEVGPDETYVGAVKRVLLNHDTIPFLGDILSPDKVQNGVPDDVDWKALAYELANALHDRLLHV